MCDLTRGCEKGKRNNFGLAKMSWPNGCGTKVRLDHAFNRNTIVKLQNNESLFFFSS